MRNMLTKVVKSAHKPGGHLGARSILTQPEAKED